MTRMNKRTLAAGVGACALLLGSSFGLTTFAGKSDAHAADFPSKPIEVVVPFKPGGRTDTVARLLGKKIQEKGWLSQPFVIVNAAGGGGANAVSRMKRGDTDGHTAVHWHALSYTFHARSFIHTTLRRHVPRRPPPTHTLCCARSHSFPHGRTALHPDVLRRDRTHYADAVRTQLRKDTLRRAAPRCGALGHNRRCGHALSCDATHYAAVGRTRSC